MVSFVRAFLVAFLVERRLLGTMRAVALGRGRRQSEADRKAGRATFPPGSPQRSLAIVIDGVVQSAPALAEGINPDEGLDPDAVVITIGLSDNPQQESEDLAAILRYGSLPVTFEHVNITLAN